MGQPHILVVSNGALCRNPRVVKEATALGENGYDVTVLTIRNHLPSEPHDQEILASAPFRRKVLDLLGPGAPRFRAKALRWISIKLLGRIGWQSAESLGPALALLKKARTLPAALTIVHNEVPFWIGTRLLAEGRRVAADFEDWHSEDLLPAARRHRPLRLLRKMERRLLTHAAYTSTTSHALADALHARYGGTRPRVITNSFPLQTVTARPAPHKTPTFFWFSQTLGPGRGLEFFLNAWKLTRQPSELVLLGEPCAGYAAHLINLLPPNFHSRLRFLPLVSPAELPAVIARHDIGLALEESTIVNRDLTITNKILQYLNAGLAVVATETAGQREVLAHAPVAGLVMPTAYSRDWAAHLDLLLSNPQELAVRKATARGLAESIYCWEREAPKLVQCVADALSPSPSRHSGEPVG